jgi:hypothetical protein
MSVQLFGLYVVESWADEEHILKNVKGIGQGLLYSAFPTFALTE